MEKKVLSWFSNIQEFPALFLELFFSSASKLSFKSYEEKENKISDESRNFLGNVKFSPDWRWLWVFDLTILVPTKKKCTLCKADHC